jgi:hypothetical protein
LWCEACCFIIIRIYRSHVRMWVYWLFEPFLKETNMMPIVIIVEFFALKILLIFLESHSLTVWGQHRVMLNLSRHLILIFYIVVKDDMVVQVEWWSNPRLISMQF